VVGGKNVPITCPTNTPEDLFFLFATTIQISNRELTRALRNLVVSLRGNPTLLNKSLSSSKLASSRRPHRKLTPSFSKKCLSTVEIFGHGRSRRARCASAPELTPSSWPQYATSVASAASGGFEVLALFSMFSSANADSSLPRCTARASSPVAENAGAPFRGPSSATRYLESLFGTTRQPRSSDPRRASRFFAPGRPPVQQGARGDATRAAARNMSPRVRKCARRGCRGDNFGQLFVFAIVFGFGFVLEIEKGHSLRGAPWGDGASHPIRTPRSMPEPGARARFRKARLPRRRTGSWVSCCPVRTSRRRHTMDGKF
jgi:hypothetical protein